MLGLFLELFKVFLPTSVKYKTASWAFICLNENIYFYHYKNHFDSKLVQSDLTLLSSLQSAAK